MSLKGLQKAAVRAPQSIKARFNVGEHTKDAVYIDSERRFTELERETKKLHDESKKYFEAINGMLNHQIEFSKAVQEIYKPISGRVSDPNSLIPEGNPEGIEACEQYEAIVRDLQATLAPELEMIQARVIDPADELLKIIKVVQKSTQKRQHKQLDYDRHRATLKKLQDKPEKSIKDEKALYKAESDVEQATQDYEYFNDLLKEELPRLFALEREFIGPLFQSFYYMQLNVFYTLHEKMQNIDIGYFNLMASIEDGFEEKRGDVQASAETLSIVKFKTTGGRRPGAASRYGQPNRLAIEGRRSNDAYSRPLVIEGGPSSSAGGAVTRARRSTNEYGTSNLPPPYQASQNDNQDPSQDQDQKVSGSSTVARARSTAGTAWSAAARNKGGVQTAIPTKASFAPASVADAASTGVSPAEAQLQAQALYDYEAQAEGDLTFATGDVIDVVEKGATENEWWRGILNGVEGQFPGNYVRLI